MTSYGNLHSLLSFPTVFYIPTNKQTNKLTNKQISQQTNYLPSSGVVTDLLALMYLGFGAFVNIYQESRQMLKKKNTLRYNAQRGVLNNYLCR